jgi:hypothetical protein
MGDARNLREKRSLTDVLLSLWWISWFGIISGFLLVGSLEYWREHTQGSAASGVTLSLLIVITLMWVGFFVAEEKAQNREPVTVSLLTIIGTFLAIFTMVGIYFFIYIAPHIQ